MKPRGHQEQWRRVVPRATATGSAWIHAPPLMKVAEPVDRGRIPLFFLVGGDCYLYRQQETQKKGHKQLILAFSFFVFFLDLHFSLLLLRVCFTAGQFVMGFVFFSSASGGRSGGAAVADVAVMGRSRRCKTGGRR